MYRPFEQARAVARGLGLGSSGQWREWAKSGSRPSNIPSNPNESYKHEGWQDWGDWLGTRTVAKRGRIYRSFQEARALVRNQGLRNQQEWRAWSKSDNRPEDIPATPNEVYQTEWHGLDDWLGTGRVSPADRVHRPFAEAQAFARSLGLKSRQEWTTWSRSGERPKDIPSYPNEAYAGEGWKGMNEWLGTGRRAPGDQLDRPFPQARAFARALGLDTKDQWFEWARTAERTVDIPKDPARAYRQQGWKTWGDWLGTGRVGNRNRIHRPFLEARSHVRAQGLSSYPEWREWAKSGAKPHDIPASPVKVYSGAGWRGWADWLGAASKWNRNAIVAFLEDLIPELPGLDPADLYAIMRRNGLVTASTRATNTNRDMIGRIVALASSLTPEQGIEAILDDLEVAASDAALVDDPRSPATWEAGIDDVTDLIVPPHEPRETSLPSLDTSAILRAMDRIKVLCPSADEEAVEYFVSKAVSKLWRNVLASGSIDSVETVKGYVAGEYARIVQARFLAQFEDAQNVAIPPGYRFAPDELRRSQVVPPNLMQRLIACRLREEKRLGNWSGTGAGKTMAAILASRVVDARLTVIVALNNTLEGWERQIHSAFPDSVILGHDRGQADVDRARHTYLLLNFEAFQQPDSSSMVQRLVQDHRIDMVVLDEIHSVKQRYAVASKRRQVLGGLLTLAAEHNPALHVLGMSATPVVNNLTEAVSLLELVMGVKYTELQTRATIPMSCHP
ncbi:MAG: hypothetical protein DLM70_01105 [Chloroflexi bacterium]|nr:MAG: hypothetical protein DLM70_01105 [Chloroflexota bacterium]